MPDGANEQTAVPVLPRQTTGPAAGRRGVLLLCTGVGVGLALGILLTLGVSTTFTFFTRTLPETRDSVQVFNQLDEMRQQINQLNEDNKLKEQEKEDSMRRALSAVEATAHPPDSGTPSGVPTAQKPAGGDGGPPGGVPMAQKPAGGAERPPVEKRQGDPFADIDEEIERLERTQKVLNTILDLFSRKGKEGAKDR
jgi:hypothetical protein